MLCEFIMSQSPTCRSIITMLLTMMRISFYWRRLLPDEEVTRRAEKGEYWIFARDQGVREPFYTLQHIFLRTSFVFGWSGQVSSVLVTRWSLTDQNDDDHWRLKWLESIGQFRWNQSNRPEMLNEPNRGVHGKIQIYCRSGAIRREPRKQRNKDRKTVYFRFFLEAS